jgi:hypothetical protein
MIRIKSIRSLHLKTRVYLFFRRRHGCLSAQTHAIERTAVSFWPPSTCSRCSPLWKHILPRTRRRSDRRTDSGNIAFLQALEGTTDPRLNIGQLRDAVSAFVEKEVAPRADEADRANAFPNVRNFAKLELMCRLSPNALTLWCF